MNSHFFSPSQFCSVSRDRSAFASPQASNSTDLLLSPFTSDGRTSVLTLSNASRAFFFTSATNFLSLKNSAASAHVSWNRICPIPLGSMNGRTTRMYIIYSDKNLLISLEFGRSTPFKS
ncbi:hypothetical protein PanWU01x14_308820 [Parasponia andersonii]|uniref:Uncharacterized protein n=1 Tax=Parasponia andersonii TaxID=3476 RepID=A0A2P5AQV5_PARAD|nr:hypothetical protein PanWU01x14_308820 [Parasponia andersonii]